MKIDFVAPPFSGHLYPALQLACGLQSRSQHSIRVFSTSSAREAVANSALDFHEILPGRDEEVWAIANTPQRVGSNPVKLWRQVRSNLGLMSELQQQLLTEWAKEPPDLTIVDFVVPVAGLTAAEMGIRWWTGMPSPCALESTEGVPSYLGGWQPRNDLFGRMRDWSGRKIVRTFKNSTRFLFRHELAALGIRSLYRPDQSEVVYSSEKILGYGMKELEFPKKWPDCFQFIGALPLPPSRRDIELPKFRDGRKTILVSLGTHLHWARDQFEEKIRNVAKLLPEFDFHFTTGGTSNREHPSDSNFVSYRFIPYKEVLDRYAATIHHAGTGIMYACLNAGLPSLIAPQDFDQFDHAARLIHHRLANRLPNKPEEIAPALQLLLSNQEIGRALHEFEQISKKYDPVSNVLELLSQIEKK